MKEPQAKAVHYTDVPADVFGDEAPGVTIRWVIDEPHDGARVMAWGMSGLGLIAIASPTLGGAVAALAGWRAALALVACIGAAALAYVTWWVPETARRLRPDATRPAVLLSAWRRIATHPVFVGWALLTTCTYGGLFTILAGSLVVGAWSGTGKAQSTQRVYASYRAQHQKLVADGSIVVEGKVGRLTRDVPFTSPSTAGAVALGRSCNGRIEWVWEGGNYADWENRGLAI